MSHKYKYLSVFSRNFSGFGVYYPVKYPYPRGLGHEVPGAGWIVYAGSHILGVVVADCSVG